MNHSTVSGCGEIEHSENSRKSGQQKNPTARKQLDISIKRTLKIGHRLCRFCAIQQRKEAAATSLPQLFGGSWWIRKPRSKKQSAGLFFAVCGWPTCSNPVSYTHLDVYKRQQHTQRRHTVKKNVIIILFDCIQVLPENGFPAHGIDQRNLQT